MLLVNGINVYPREIEEILYQYPGVREAAVIGVPDARKGEQPLAFVSANELTALNPAAMLQFLRERLADYKLPRQIIVLADLPRNATGKIFKTRLREMLAGRGTSRRRSNGRRNEGIWAGFARPIQVLSVLNTKGL